MSRSAIKAILFDLDDTLWSIVPVIERAERVLHDWLERHAPAVARAVTIESMRARRQALMDSDPVYQLDLRRLRHTVLSEAMCEHGCDPALADDAIDVFSRERNQVEPFADVVPGLSRLARRYALGSVSNGVADLQVIGLAHFFRASVAAHQLGLAKPEPAIFHAACEALQVRPEESVYVGDDPLLDVQGAQRAGLAAVWLDRGLHPGRTVPAHVRPDAVCADLHALHDWLERQGMTP